MYDFRILTLCSIYALDLLTFVLYVIVTLLHSQ